MLQVLVVQDGGEHRSTNSITNKHELWICIVWAMSSFSALLAVSIHLITSLNMTLTLATIEPNAFQVLHHPLFWDSDKRLSFLRDVSDRLKLESRKRGSNLLITLESVAGQAFGNRWDKKMESALIKDTNRCGNYRYNSVQDLLRVVRNKLNHYHDSPWKIQELLGPIPEGIDNYFSCRFPRLLMEAYKVVVSNCRAEKCFEKYFGPDSVPIV